MRIPVSIRTGIAGSGDVAIVRAVAVLGIAAIVKPRGPA